VSGGKDIRQAKAKADRARKRAEKKAWGGGKSQEDEVVRDADHNCEIRGDADSAGDMTNSGMSKDSVDVQAARAVSADETAKEKNQTGYKDVRLRARRW
jgi:hypothetical protein